MKNNTLLMLSTVHSAVQELHEQHIGICGINEDGVHVSDSFFIELFQDKREIVGRRDLNSKEMPFMYFTHIFGTKFYCISANPDLFPTHPVEKLAQDLFNEWRSKGEEMQKYGLAYHDGAYKIVYKKLITEGQTGLLEYMGTMNEKTYYKENIEKAILDHMEAKYNENN